MSVTDNPHAIVRNPPAAPRSGWPERSWIRARSPRRSWRRVRLSVSVRWQAARLDRELAAGLSPRSSELLAHHARRITGRRSRISVADGLARTLRSANDAIPAFAAAVRPHGQEVLTARPVLAALERRVRGPEPIAPRGMAMLRSLLTDGTSPLYRPDEHGALGSQLRAAAAALGPGDWRGEPG